MSRVSKIIDIPGFIEDEIKNFPHHRFFSLSFYDFLYVLAAMKRKIDRRFWVFQDIKTFFHASDLENFTELL